MCEALVELRQAMQRCCQAFDADLLEGPDATRAMQEAAAVENMAAALKARSALRVADTGVWRDTGERSAAHHLAKRAGSSVGTAAEAIVTARRLHDLPATDAATRRGELSAQQAFALADAASAEPAAEHRLLSIARKGSLAELREEAARIKAKADPDPEERRRRIHARRRLRSYTDPEGAWHLSVVDNPERGAQVMAALSPITDRLFKAARSEGRREPVEAYGADALFELATATRGDSAADPDKAKACSTGAKVIFRLDVEAAFRGYAVDGETCDIAGFGPVAVSAVREVLATAHPFVAAVLTKGEQVLGVAHLGRRPTAKQRTALEWMSHQCSVLGCSASSHLETDHRADWARTHVTVLEALDKLCKHHHRLKTTEGWALVEGRGKRPFVGPDDPRHPRCRPPPGEEHSPPEAEEDPPEAA